MRPSLPRVLGALAIGVACAGVVGASSARDEGPRVIVLRLGETATFPAGVLEPGDLVRCEDAAGRDLGGAYIDPPGIATIGHSDGPELSVTVGVSTNEDGSVDAGCVSE